MRYRVGWWLVAVLLLVGPARARAQFNVVPPKDFTAFLSHPRYEDGGFFVGMDFLYIRSENIIGNQTVGVRGFKDMDGSITGTPNTFIGSGQEALNTQQLHGPRNFIPGFEVNLGWRFEDGTTVSLNWWHLSENHMYAAANLIPPDFNVGSKLENTYLYAPVSNFPQLYGGNPGNVLVGNPGATYGIWNAASLMSITLLQRFELIDVTTRAPVLQTENYRAWWTFGPRAVILFDRFQWRTVSSDAAGNAVASDVAIYSNVVSNRLYGPFIGCGNEWFLGSTPIGGFSVSLDVEGALYLDMVKERARWETGARNTSANRNRNNYTLSPGLQGKIGFWWYPWEAVTFHLGWDALVFFNTVTSREPIDFNFASLNPQYDYGTIRYFHGLNLGIGFVF